MLFRSVGQCGLPGIAIHRGGQFRVALGTLDTGLKLCMVVPLTPGHGAIQGTKGYHWRLKARDQRIPGKSAQTDVGTGFEALAPGDIAIGHHSVLPCTILLVCGQLDPDVLRRTSRRQALQRQPYRACRARKRSLPPGAKPLLKATPGVHRPIIEHKGLRQRCAARN